MLAQQTVDTPQMTEASHQSTFFRQSGWMMIATVMGGVFMSLVHAFAKVLPKQEYSAMAALFQVLVWMGIPALGLQMVFAQQASAVITQEQKKQLVGTTRAVLLWTFLVWLIMAVVAVIGHRTFIAALKLSNPMAFWLTIVIGLAAIWFPILQGLLQGRQNFLWLGWTAIFNGVGRFGIVVIVVTVLHGLAAGIMGGVLIGFVAAVSTGAWQNRDLIWKETSARFEAAAWLRRVLPLTLGCGAFQFLFSADAIVAQSFLGGDDGQAAPYLFGGTMARAIILLIAPLAAVMFPKLVHSAARSQKTNLLGMTLLGTIIIGIVSVIGLSIVGPLLIRRVFPAFVSIIPLLPLFGACMVPLAVANVLLNNLMAHSRFKVVPFLVATAIGYWFALQHYHADFKQVIHTFGIFSLIFLAICAFFTWVPKDRSKIVAAE
jgi:O-antigen/teichoic acid export membrane protein